MSQRSLKSQDDIRRALAHVFREIEADRMDPTKGRVLIYAAMSISTVLAEHSLESRIAALEEAASQKRAA